MKTIEINNHSGGKEMNCIICTKGGADDMTRFQNLVYPWQPVHRECLDKAVKRAIEKHKQLFGDELPTSLDVDCKASCLEASRLEVSNEKRNAL